MIRSCFSQRIALSLFASALLLSSSLPSEASAWDQYLPKCHKPNPVTKSGDYPGENKMILSNNLAKPTGKADYADGQLLYISGQVVDEKCIPVSGALVDIWQTNPFGQYRWATQQELLNPLPVFAGNGRAMTDNLGRYSFITLFPGTYGKNAPHIHVRVARNGFAPVETSLYFRGDRRNASDPRLQAFKATDRDLLLGDAQPRSPSNPRLGIDVTFDITLKGKQMFRGY